MHRYLAALAFAAVVLFYFAFGYGLGNATAVVGLACVAAVAERGRVRLGEASEVSISLLPTVFAAAMFGPLAGMIVAAASFIGDFPLLLDSRRRTRSGPSSTTVPYVGCNP